MREGLLYGGTDAGITWKIKYDSEWCVLSLPRYVCIFLNTRQEIFCSITHIGILVWILDLNMYIKKVIFVSKQHVLTPIYCQIDADSEKVQSNYKSINSHILIS